MRKLLIWLGVLILALALGVLGFKHPGPLENLPSTYHLGMMVGGVLLLLADLLWAFLSVRGWWRRRRDQDEYEEDYDKEEEGEPLGWGALPQMILPSGQSTPPAQPAWQPASPTPPATPPLALRAGPPAAMQQLRAGPLAPSASVQPLSRLPVEEEENEEGGSWGKWLIVGAVVIAIVVGIGLAAITSGGGPSQPTISGRPATTQQRTLQPAQRGLGVQASVPEKEQPTEWFFVIIPYALWLGICVGLWQFWAEITRPEELGPLKQRFNFRGGGSAQVDVKLIMHGRFDPASLWRQQMVGLDEASSVMIGIVSEQVRSQIEALSVFDYQEVKNWAKETNRALAARAKGLAFTKEQDDLIEFLALQEDRTGYEITQIVLGTLELDAAANQRLREHQEVEEERRRVAGVPGVVEGVIVPIAASLTLAEEFIAFCTQTGLERNEATLREWITLQRDDARAEVEKMEAQAASIRAQALSEIADIDFDRLVDSIARIVETVVVGRSARQTGGI